jgi:nitrogen fixation/metabolism regulation signal transduction histidine kinase
MRTAKETVTAFYDAILRRDLVEARRYLDDQQIFVGLFETGIIFDAFVTTKSRGMGLGLAICQMIAQRHSGQLLASSDGVDGSLFQLILPLVDVSHIGPRER